MNGSEVAILAGGTTALIFAATTLILFCLVVWLFLQRKKTAQTLSSAQDDLERFKAITDVEAEVERIRVGLRGQQAEKVKVQVEIERSNTALKAARSQLLNVEEQHQLEQAGFYQPDLDLMGSDEYAAKLKDIRTRQKQLIKDKKALVCSAEWSVNGSKAEGRKQTNKLIKLGLSAFNTQADNIILKVSYKNYDRSETNIKKIATNIGKLMESNSIKLQPAFLNLKLAELRLAHRYQAKKQSEKEEQQRIKAKMREEEKELKDLQRQQKLAEKEQRTFEQALLKARKEVASVTAEAREALLAKIKELESSLSTAEGKARAISQAQLTKSGHVYVISNIGSFGEDVFKIGMTRRLEPEVRVRELSNASVPFSFDIHAMMYADNAPALETALHQRFTDRRVNKVNSRKEYFRVSLKEIESAVAEMDIKAEFTRTAEATQYWLSKNVGSPENGG